MIDAQIAADADNPRLKIGSPIERVQRLENLQKDVLRQILRLVVLAHELVGDVEHLSPVLANDGVPGGLIAAEALLDKNIGRCRLCGGGINRHATARESYQTALRRVRLSLNYNQGLVKSFDRVDNTLHCEGVPLADLAAAEGTPLYVYSAGTIAARYRAIDEAFRGYPHSLHYALKANSTLGIARLLRTLGAGADANSGGEIDVALRAGFIPEQIVFTGVGKTTAELAQAIDLGVKTINAESEGELERIDLLARERQTRARVALRVNPDIDARSHPHISTGLKTNKFGIAMDAAREIARRAARRDALEIVGLHIHVGSQITDLDPLRRAAEAIVTLARELRDDGITIDHLDLGGGLGVSYNGSPVPSAEDYAAALLPVVRDSGLAIVLEPGRNIVAPAGALLSRVVDVKDRADGTAFVILDAGMTELLRPMLYGAFHRIE